MGAVVWALSPDPLWGLSPVTVRVVTCEAVSHDNSVSTAILASKERMNQPHLAARNARDLIRDWIACGVAHHLRQ